MRGLMGVLKKVIILCCLSGGFALAGVGRALALTEYCPAEAGTFHPIDATGPATLYAFALHAEGPRSVSGSLVFKTNAGWFVTNVPPTVLAAHVYHYGSAWVSFSRTQYESAPLYVRFFEPLTIEYAYMAGAETTGDPTFGWDTRGAVTCAPRVKPLAPFVHEYGGRDVTPVVSDPRTDLDTQPASGGAVMTASSTSEPDPSTCTQAPVDATIAKPLSPDFPLSERSRRAPGQTIIAVAISARGTIDDAWVYYPSGSQALDDAALASAKRSKYTAGSAFCQPVPGVFLYQAEFMPDP
jgi:TonB family protein